QQSSHRLARGAWWDQEGISQTSRHISSALPKRSTGCTTWFLPLTRPTATCLPVDTSRVDEMLKARHREREAAKKPMNARVFWLARRRCSIPTKCNDSK